jgi:transposase
LNLISQQFEDSLLIIQLDNGAFHKAKRLSVPKNIILFFQAAHSPELNPIQQVWQYLKRRWRWARPKNLDKLRQYLKAELEKLTPSIILASIAGRHDILSALAVAGF